MATTTVRVRPHTYRVLQEMARERGESLPETLDRLVEERRRARILQEAAEAYAAVADDPIEDALWRDEIGAWDVTVAYGLDPDPESEVDR